MDYRYNYKFLAQWMEHNNISRKNVLDAVGTRDFDSINAWKDGDRALPIGMLLRICNTFQIPLEAFFIDYDQSPAVAVPYPNANDQPEPNGGFPKDKERKNRQGLNPKAKFTRKTELPRELLVADNLKPVSIIPTGKEDNPDNTKGNPDNSNNSTHAGTYNAELTKESNAPTTKENEARDKPNEGVARSVSCNNVAAPTTAPISTTEESPDNPPLLKDSIEVLELKIKHQQELMNTQKQSRDHEDAMRSEFIHRGDKLREKLYAIIDRQQSTIDRQQQTISHQQDTITRLTSNNNNSYPDLDGLAAEQMPRQKNNVG